MNTPEHFGEYGRLDFMINGEPTSPEDVSWQDVNAVEDLAGNLIEPIPAQINKTYGYGSVEDNAGIILTTINENNAANKEAIAVQLLSLAENSVKFSMELEPNKNKPQFYCPSRAELLDASLISQRLIEDNKVDEQVRRILTHLESLILDFRIVDIDKPAKLPAEYVDSQSQQIANLVRNIVKTDADSETYLKNYQQRLKNGNRLRLQEVEVVRLVAEGPVPTPPDLQIAYDDNLQKQAYYYRKTDSGERSLNISNTDTTKFQYNTDGSIERKPGKQIIELIINGLEEASGF